MMIKNFFKNHPIHKKIVIHLDLFNLLNPLNYFLIWVLLSVGMYLGLFVLNQSPQFIATFQYKVFFLYAGISVIMSSHYIDLELSHEKNNSSIKFIKEKYSVKFIEKTKTYLNFIGLIFLFFSFWINFAIGLILFFFNKSVCKFYLDKRVALKLIYQILIAFIISISGYLFSLKDYQLLHFIPLYFKLIVPYLFLYFSVFVVLNSKIFDSKISKSIVSVGLLLIIFGILLSLKFQDPLASTSLVVSAPFFLYTLIRGLDKDFRRVYIYPLAILNFFCMTIFPYLFIASIVVFYLMKYYNWHRFDLHFPTFLVEND